MKVIVVGGADSLVKGNFTRKLNDNGVEVGWHVRGAPSIDRLPLACEGVVIIKDMVGHGLSDSARDLAAKRDIPLCSVPRKWSLAEPRMRTVGILPAATNGQVKAATPAELQDSALEYICDQRRRGRVPKYEEVNASLQRAFGPKAVIDKESFMAAHSKAASAVPVLPTSGKSLPKMSTQIQEWAKALIEDRAERICDLKMLARVVTRDLKVNDRKMVAKYVNKAVEEVRERFRSAHPDDQKWRDPIMTSWLVRQYQAYIEGKDGFPTKGVLNLKSVEIFCVTVKYGLVPEARAQAFGEWAREVFQHRKAFDYYLARRPNSQVTLDYFMGMLDKGEIQSFRSGHLLFTSKVAIDQYLKTAHGVPPMTEAKVAVFKGAPQKTEPIPQPTLVPDPAPVNTKKFAEDVVMEVATLLEGLLDRKLKPITDRLDALDIRLGEVDAQAKNNTKGIAQAQKMVAETTKVSGEIQVDVGAVADGILNLLAEAKSLKGEVAALATNVASIKTDGEPTLRQLAELARDTGLKVAIKTP